MNITECTEKQLKDSLSELVELVQGVTGEGKTFAVALISAATMDVLAEYNETKGEKQ